MISSSEFRFVFNITGVPETDKVRDFIRKYWKS